MRLCRLAHAVFLHGLLACGFAERLSQGRFGKEPDDCLGHQFVVARFYDHAAASQLLGDTADAGRHHRLFAQHGLQDDKRKGFGDAGEDDDVTLIEGSHGARAKAGEVDNLFEAKIPLQVHTAGVVRFITAGHAAKQTEFDVRAARMHQGGHAQECN